ncbi:condensation domain-containing protein [Methylicorpusculum sp.]|uniref:condensation domain-containing protein n=1 Tax=Methylicorpusculum sp. TaxID=2713644 RepID=UPI0027355E89|nr:condensation domain-containing protein [Methylicorpusculum sp.]MDP3530250.1 condensation domain-containing protein [Methylicorpusculum sp.]MDZ4153092.1 condensation domain-containing protein [Methylicorpusculum sp.]
MTEHIQVLSLPLTSAQLEFWCAACEVEPPSARSFASEYIEIHGPISTHLFQQALTHVVEDSETLRVSFVDTVDGPRQMVYTASPHWELPFLDLTSDPDPKGAAIAWMEHTLARPLELSKWPQFTFALFKITDNRFFWFQSYPHIMMDGFGLMLIAKRVAEIYTSLAADETPGAHDFKPLRVLVEEDEKYRASGRSSIDQGRWREHYADKPSSITLAGKPLLPSRDNMQDLRRTVYLSPGDTDNLMAIVKNTIKVTLAQFISAATVAYVSRMTRKTNIITLGLVSMVRTTSKERRVPGMAANILPFRLSVLQSMSITELSRQAATELALIKQIQRYRGGDLGGELSSLKNKQGVFGMEVNVMCFDYDLHFYGYSSTTHNIAAGTTDDIMINVSDRRDGCGLRIDFDGSPQYYTIDDLDKHQTSFLKLLMCAADFPDTPLEDLDFILPQMREKLTT